MPLTRIVAMALAVAGLSACAGYDAPGPSYPPPRTEAPGYVTSYVLVFENLSARDMLAWEDVFTRLPGYRSHRPTGSTGRVHNVWYESSIGSADLYRSLVQGAARLGHEVRVSFTGNEYRVQRFGSR